MITKKSKVYVLYSYTGIKWKSVNVFIKTKTAEAFRSSFKKELIVLN